MYCFKGLLKKLHDTHPQLENLNKQYRQLAREGRTDTNSALRNNVQDINNRWDNVSLIITSVLRRIRHMLAIKDDFDATRDALTLWLTDMDNKLTAMDHNTDADVQTRVDLIKVQNVSSAIIL